MAFCANFFGSLILCVLLNCSSGSYFVVVVVCDRAFEPMMMVPNCDFYNVSTMRDVWTYPENS